jgi:hypothetical protein
LRVAVGVWLTSCPTLHVAQLLQTVSAASAHGVELYVFKAHTLQGMQRLSLVLASL